jgi:hypothetical protein
MSEERSDNLVYDGDNLDYGQAEGSEVLKEPQQPEEFEKSLDELVQQNRRKPAERPVKK